MAWTTYGIDNNDMIDQIKACGILHSERVSNVVRKVDRSYFCPIDPYKDQPQKIGFGATISAPHMHIISLQVLEKFLVKGAKVLDIGSGSGYLTACFAELVGPTGRVIGLEHIHELVHKSIDNIASVNLEASAQCWIVLEADGREGYFKEAPYDVIHIGAATEEIPDTLINQLKTGGHILAPIGKANDSQKYILYEKSGDDVKPQEFMSVRFVPLTDVQCQMEARYFTLNSNERKGTGHMDYLDDHSLLLIFSYLPLRDWLLCERVSSRWNLIIKKQWKSLKRLNLATFLGLRPVPPCQIQYTLPTITCKMMRGLGIRCGRNLKELVSGGSKLRVHLEIFPILVSLFPKLITLHLNKCLFIWEQCEDEEESQMKAYHFEVGGTFPNLTDLDFGETFDETARQYHERETMELILNKLLSAMPDIGSITLTHNTSLNGTSLMSLPPTLLNLNIDCCRRIEGPILAFALQKLVHLKSLSLYSCDKIEGCYIQYISPTVEQVNISYCDSVDSDSVMDLLESHPKLSSMDMGHLKCMDNKLLKVVSQCDKLKQIDLSSYLPSGYMEGEYIPAQVHSLCLTEGLMYITCMSHLTHLDLNRNLFVDAQMLYQISSKCKSLEVLNVSQLSITDPHAYSSLSKVKSLRVLDMGFNDCVDEGVLQAMALGDTNLEYVSCRNCPDINSAVIKRIGLIWKNTNTVFQIY